MLNQKLKRRNVKFVRKGDVVTIRNLKFETALYTRQEIEAVIKNGVRVEAILTRPFIVSFDWTGIRPDNDNFERWQLEVPFNYKAAPSVPPWLRSISPATGAIVWMSYPHDFLYEFHSMSRADTDEMFVEGIRTGGGGWWERNRAYAAVRVGGSSSWNKHKGEMTLIGLTKVEL